MPTKVIHRSQIGSVRRGDVITHIDGRPVGPFTVRARATPKVIPCEPGARVVEVNIYPETNIVSELTIERTKRSVSRTISGVRWSRDDNGSWHTEDGRYTIEYNYAGYTECENPHPTGKDGGYCYGGETHVYYGWQLWDHQTDDYVGGSPNHYETFTAAASDVPKS